MIHYVTLAAGQADSLVVAVVPVKEPLDPLVRNNVIKSTMAVSHMTLLVIYVTTRILVHNTCTVIIADNSTIAYPTANKAWTPDKV
jgi:hypothetical protein